MPPEGGLPPFPGQLPVQLFDERIYEALGISARRGFSPHLLPYVLPVVAIPLGDSADGGGSGTSALSGYIGGSVRTPATQAQAQLYNPVGSGFNLLLDRLSFSMGSPGIGEFRFGAVALGNLEMQGAAKALGSSAGAGAVRWESNAVGSGTVVAYFDAAAGGVFYEWTFAQPIIIPPGQGANIRNPTAASRLAANFEWREQAL